MAIEHGPLIGDDVPITTSVHRGFPRNGMKEAMKPHFFEWWRRRVFNGGGPLEGNQSIWNFTMRVSNLQMYRIGFDRGMGLIWEFSSADKVEPQLCSLVLSKGIQCIVYRVPISQNGHSNRKQDNVNHDQAEGKNTC